MNAPLEFVIKEQHVLILQEVLIVLVIKVLLGMGHFVKVVFFCYFYFSFRFLSFQFSKMSIDIDECALGAEGCSINSTCINTAGSYYCYCPNGLSNIDGLCTGFSNHFSVHFHLFYFIFLKKK